MPLKTEKSDCVEGNASGRSNTRLETQQVAESGRSDTSSNEDKITSLMDMFQLSRAEAEQQCLLLMKKSVSTSVDEEPQQMIDFYSSYSRNMKTPMKMVSLTLLFVAGSLLIKNRMPAQKNNVLSQQKNNVLSPGPYISAGIKAEDEFNESDIMQLKQYHTYAGTNKDIVIFPVSFSAPEELWEPVVTFKKVGFASSIPGNRSTYTFKDEDAYRESYKHALFGVTRKKAGWDCMRHLEIMAAGCVPFFIDIEKMPLNTMQFYPKDLLRRVKLLPGIHYNGSALDPSSFSVNFERFDFPEYYKIATQILEHSRKHLTTRAMAQYVLNTVGKPLPKRALIATSCRMDYLQDSILHGLKRVLGMRLVDFVPAAEAYVKGGGGSCPRVISNTTEPPFADYRVNMYMDSWAAASEEHFHSRLGYGMGFTIWNRLGDYLHVNPGYSKIVDDLVAGQFDVVFLSYRIFFHPSQEQFLKVVRRHVPREKVVILVGGDKAASAAEARAYSSMGSWIFQREIND